MKTLKLALVAITAASVLAAASTVKAQVDLEQSQSQDLEVRCEVGAYGEDVNCTARGSQDQYQRASMDGVTVIYRDGVAVPVHNVVDTSLNLQTLMATAGSLLTGATATFIKLKTRS